MVSGYEGQGRAMRDIGMLRPERHSFEAGPVFRSIRKGGRVQNARLAPEELSARVTPKKKRKAETAAFMLVAEAPLDLMCS